ncbi:MAG TPA: 50S ribosomal protein L24 [Candidatus Azoamicus sp.]
MNKIKIKDKIVILAGKDKGKIGVVSKVLKNKKSNKQCVIIEGLNLVKKHSKAIPNKNKTGGIITIEKPIDYSNVALFCESENKSSKIFFNFSDNKKKSRFFKVNKEVIN